jgi:hypothetical protein
MATETAKPYTSNATTPMATGSTIFIYYPFKKSGFTGGPCTYDAWSTKHKDV